MASVSAAAPGVLGVTGMETVEILKGMVTHVQPWTPLIAIDALAARSSSRIASTIQIADTGITPGSGRRQPPKGTQRADARRTGHCGGGAAGRLCFDDASDASMRLAAAEVEEERIAACCRAGRFPQAGGNGGDAAARWMRWWSACRAFWRTASIRRFSRI